MQYKTVEEMTKIELIDKCKKQRFVLQRLNKEIEELKEQLEYYKALAQKNK